MNLPIPLRKSALAAALLALGGGLFLAAPSASRAQINPAQESNPGTGSGAAEPPANGALPATGGNNAAGNDGLIQQAQEGPIDIASTGETTYSTTAEGHIATSTGNVNIQTNDASIFCDYAEYNVDIREALLIGNVRIYRTDNTILAERAVYNFNTKAIRALEFSGSRVPYNFTGQTVFSPGAGLQYNLRRGEFTTDDSSKPDFRLRARRVRIYPDNRIIYIGTTLYVGQTPIFYFPYFYQSLDQQSGYTISPGYTSEYGAYLLTGITFPITEHITGLARFDYRSTRGTAAGLSFDYKPNRKPKKAPVAGETLAPYASDDDPSQAASVVDGGVPATTSPNNQSNLTGTGNQESSGTTNGEGGRNPGYALTGEALSRQLHNREGAQMLTYFARDDKPDLNRTSLGRLPISSNRYRVQLKDTTFFGDDFYLKLDVDKISDRYLLQDFYQGEFTRNPNPDNVASLVFYQPHFITTLIARAQLNDFFNTTERLPELALDVPRLPLGKTGLNYNSETSAGYLRRTFDDASPLPDYTTFRLDTFHQLTYPKTYLGWLSVVPRVGARATYYTHSAPDNTSAYNLQLQADDTADRLLFGLNPAQQSLATQKSIQGLRNTIDAFDPQGGVVRPVVNVGVEVSFKLSKVYKDIESRAVGLDQLQHVIQPYVNASVAEDFGVGSRELLQFDRLLPTTQLEPIDFPQFTSIDSIDETSSVRVGVRNRLQTKRDALSINWLELDTFFQANINGENERFPNEKGLFSNVFNQLTLRPLPWVNLTLNSQLPILNPNTGFTEVNTSLNFLPTSNLELTVSHRYLNDNPFFLNSNLVGFGAFYRINDNWAVSAIERYEVTDNTLEAQSYTVYRDLTSFVASLAVTVRNNSANSTNKSVNDYGFLLNFTLKGIPKVSLPVGFDAASLTNQAAQ